MSNDDNQTKGSSLLELLDKMAAKTDFGANFGEDWSDEELCAAFTAPSVDDLTRDLDPALREADKKRRIDRLLAFKARVNAAYKIQ